MQKTLSIVRICVGLVATLAILVPVLILITDTLTPRQQTDARMISLRAEIMQFARANNRLPGALNELPTCAKQPDQINDGWGRPIIYRCTPGWLVTLRSYGKDGAPGGEGDDEDITGTFRAKATPQLWPSDGLAWVDPSDASNFR